MKQHNEYRTLSVPNMMLSLIGAILAFVFISFWVMWEPEGIPLLPIALGFSGMGIWAFSGSFLLQKWAREPYTLILLIVVGALCLTGILVILFGSFFWHTTVMWIALGAGAAVAQAIMKNP